jgi:hypothetical protein
VVIRALAVSAHVDQVECRSYSGALGGGGVDEGKQQLGLFNGQIINYSSIGTIEERNRYILRMAHREGYLIFWRLDSRGTATIEMNGIRQDLEYGAIPPFVIGVVRALRGDIKPYNCQPGLLTREEESDLNRKVAGLRRRGWRKEKKDA